MYFVYAHAHGIVGNPDEPTHIIRRVQDKGGQIVHSLFFDRSQQQQRASVLEPRREFLLLCVFIDCVTKIFYKMYFSPAEEAVLFPVFCTLLVVGTRPTENIISPEQNLCSFNFVILKKNNCMFM